MTTEESLQEISKQLKEIIELLVVEMEVRRENTILQGVFDPPEGFKKWKNANNSKPSPGDKNTKPSKTIPDQAMSITELMSRFARGLPLGGKRVENFDEDPENPMPDLHSMDIIDQHATIEAAKSEMYDIAGKYRKEKEEQKQKAYNEYKTKFEELDKKFKEQQQQGNFKFNPDDKSGKDAAI